MAMDQETKEADGWWRVTKYGRGPFYICPIHGMEIDHILGMC